MQIKLFFFVVHWHSTSYSNCKTLSDWKRLYNSKCNKFVSYSEFVSRYLLSHYLQQSKTKLFPNQSALPTNKHTGCILMEFWMAHASLAIPYRVKLFTQFGKKGHNYLLPIDEHTFINRFVYLHQSIAFSLTQWVKQNKKKCSGN